MIERVAGATSLVRKGDRNEIPLTSWIVASLWWQNQLAPAADAFWQPSRLQLTLN
jgi:hypothetical protein